MVLALIGTVSSLLITPALAIPEPSSGVTLYFKKSAVELTRTDQSLLRGLTKELNAGDRVDVVGLPSDREPSSHTLSRQRAEKVAAFLIAEGVDPGKVRVKTLTPPKKKPLTREAAEELHTQKVEIVISPAEL